MKIQVHFQLPFTRLGIFIDSPFREQTRAATTITTKKEYYLLEFIILRTSQHFFSHVGTFPVLNQEQLGYIIILKEKCGALVRLKHATPDLKSSVLPVSHCAPRRRNNTPDRRQSKIVINRVFDCHLSPECRQMAIENSVSNDKRLSFVA